MFTYGFYNSFNGDRKYNAFEMSKLFDGIILDGVFETIGQHFAVTASTGMSVNVGTGRAWFNHTWNENDSVMPLNIPESDLNRSRYDAVVIEVGDPNTDRVNAIKVVSGTPAVNPSKPVLNRGPMNNSSVSPDDENALPPYQHALAYILVQPGVEEITTADIEIVVGRDETPFVTGPLETRSIEELFLQWDSQFSNWFNNLKAQLTDNVVTNLQSQIDSNREAIESIEERTNGLRVETKTYTEIITESRDWTNPYSVPLPVSVLLFGGGGGCGSGASSNTGGAGGHMATWNGTLDVKENVHITIGEGGNSDASGGTTSFGTYASANGGNSGQFSLSEGIRGCGGSGGGGGCDYNGGSGSYGGGGGGGMTTGSFIAHTASGWKSRSGLPGGNGGAYGGGGGGGGGIFGNAGVTNGGNGGAKGEYGGAGGTGGGTASSFAGLNGGAGTNTNSLTLDFKGTGASGKGGAADTRQGTWGSTIMSVSAGGGGGGGGGYGGKGGDGASGNGVQQTSSDVTSLSGSGGGGGGYGANGGTASTPSAINNGTIIMHWGGGGGGGGYGGKGGNSGYSGQGYGSGGGFKRTDQDLTGGGGGGYGKYPSSENRASGYSGVCVIRYTIKEVILE